MDYQLELKSKKDEAVRKLKDISFEKIEDIIPSPVSIRYRNKINLSIGYNEYKCIEVGTMRKNKTIEAAEKNIYCSNIALKICIFVKDWIINISQLLPVSYPNLDGFWRHITIHNTKYNTVMIVFHIQSLYKYIDLWEKEKLVIISKLNIFLSQNNYKLKSVFYQNSDSLKETRNYNKYCNIFGDNYIIEKLDIYNFKISPSSFFQVNSYTAEIIYNKLLVLSNLDKNKVVLDICCGTGTIGIFLAKKCYKVYGIDSNASCIEDAEDNAKLNNISNIEFITEKAELGLKNILNNKDIIGKEIIAIVNPPRRGLYAEVINTIKECPNLSQLIYVSCNINSMIHDLGILNIDNTKIKNIVQVDQFPKTKFYEIITNIGLN